MSRHGYSDECENFAMWRGVIMSATRGKRGQAFFRALVAALDGMTEKRLVAGDLQDEEGAVCALGCLGKAKGVDVSTLDTHDWHELGGLFNIAPQLAQEVMFMNDEGGAREEANRWKLVRDWAARQIRVAPNELTRREPPSPGACTVPPAGWVCTRRGGHDGPCAASKAPIPGAGEKT